MSRERDVRYDVIRVVAMMFVIAVHVNPKPFNSIPWFKDVFDYIIYTCNGMFFMLSGLFNMKRDFSSKEDYKIYYQKRFPNYQGKKLPDIDWQEMINTELDDVSQKTIRNAWSLVCASLKDVKYPVPNVKLAAVPVNDIPFLQPEEILPFCDAIKGRSYEIPCLLMLHGLRLSEVRGLDWKNVDLTTNTITIKEARVRGENGNVTKNTNKNKSSSRTVPIMIPQLVTALNAVTDKSGSVACIDGGTLLDDVKRACKRAGVTEVSCHGLRHSFASLCYFLKDRSNGL